MSESKKSTTHVRGQEATLVVSRTAFGQETEETTTIQVRPFIADAPVGSVTAKLGRTINLQNFESARVDVAFTVPGYVSELVPLYHAVMGEVKSIMADEVATIARGIQKKNNDCSVDELI